MATARRPDMVIFVATMAILVMGVIMVFSASYATAGDEAHDAYYFIKKQLTWVVVGTALLILAMRVDYRFWRHFALPGLVASVGLLGLVLLIGSDIGGARRWIDLGPLRMQPSEVTKLAIVNFLAAFIAGRSSYVSKFWKGFVLPLFFVLVTAGLIMLEPDLGTSIAIAGVAVVMLFAAGTPMRYLSLLGLSSIPAVYGLILMAPYRMRRLTAFLDPWADPKDSGWNPIQALFAIGSGRLFGLGLGESRQKFHYLPEQHTDFIFGIIGEELGFVGGATLIILFFILAWRGYRTALKAPDLFGSMLAVGITTMIVMQAAMNIAVVTVVIPTTGITLPMVSFGGSSLSITLAGIGVLMNISSAGSKAAKGV